MGSRSAASAPSKKRRTTKASSKDLGFVEVEYNSDDTKKQNKKKVVSGDDEDDDDYVDDNEGKTAEMVSAFSLRPVYTCVYLDT